MALVNEVVLDSIPSLMETGATYHAQHLRRIYKVLAKGTGGVLGGAVTAQGTPNMTVAVAALQAVVTGTQDALHQGVYLAETFASKNVTIQASDPTNDRIDRVVIGAYDLDYAGARYAGVLGIVQGTPAGSPVVPAMPVDGSFFELAQVRVRHGSASILTTDITDVRLGYGPAIAQPIYPAGLNGFSGSQRLLGAVTSGPPTAGTYLAGDCVYDTTRSIEWLCITAGTPGTWAPIHGQDRYFALVTQVAAQNLPANFVSNLVNFDTIEGGAGVGDPNSNFGTGTHLYTCPLAGRYLVIGSVFINNAGAGVLAVFAYKNGVNFRRIGQSYSTSNQQATGSTMVRCAAGDTLAIWAAQSTAGAIAMNVGTDLTYGHFAYLGR